MAPAASTAVMTARSPLRPRAISANRRDTASGSMTSTKLGVRGRASARGVAVVAGWAREGDAASERSGDGDKGAGGGATGAEVAEYAEYDDDSSREVTSTTTSCGAA